MAGPQLELCAGTYRARQLSGNLVVFAEGIHPTGGFHAFLACDAADPTTPSFALWHVRPSGPVLQIATPFSVWTAFQTMHAISRAIIRDATGVHEVSVDHAIDRAASHAG